MSEMENLKKAADEALRQQRFDALNAYIDELGVKIEAARLVARKASFIHIATCVGWVATAFTGIAWLHAVGWFAFLVTMLYSHLCDKAFTNAISEFEGMHNTLERLGLIECKCGGKGRKRKRRKVLSEFREMVKGWAITKEKARKEAYAPA